MKFQNPVLYNHYANFYQTWQKASLDEKGINFLTNYPKKEAMIFFRS